MRLGAARADLEGEFGLALDTYAKLVGVSRQKLHRWQGVAQRLANGGG